MITITIDENKIKNYGLSPTYVYKRLCEEHVNRLNKEYGYFHRSMHHYCDNAARELYCNIIGRVANVKSLILTYEDAEKCFELFKKFANVWSYQMSIETKGVDTNAKTT